MARKKFLQSTEIDPSHGVIKATWLLDDPRKFDGTLDTQYREYDIETLKDCIDVAVVALTPFLDEALKGNSDWQRVDAYHVPNMHGVIVRAANALRNSFPSLDLEKTFFGKKCTEEVLMQHRQRFSFFSDRHILVGRILEQVVAFHDARDAYSHSQMSDTLREIDKLTKSFTALA